MQWEYFVETVRVPTSTAAADLTAHLEKRGKEEWDLVSVDPSVRTAVRGGLATYDRMLWWRRPAKEAVGDVTSLESEKAEA